MGVSRFQAILCDLILPRDLQPYDSGLLALEGISVHVIEMVDLKQEAASYCS